MYEMFISILISSIQSNQLKRQNITSK